MAVEVVVVVVVVVVVAWSIESRRCRPCACETETTNARSSSSPCLKSKVPIVGNDPFMEIANMSKQNTRGESWIESCSTIYACVF